MKHFLILSFVIISVGANAQKFRQEIQDYNSVVNLRNETLAPKKNDKAFIQTTKHLYSYDSADNTSTDDGLNTIIQTSGSKRWKCLNCHLRVELSQDSILLQYDANDILVQRDTIRLTGGGPDKFHTYIVGTAPYDPLNQLAGWVAPSSPIAGNTVEVKFTDGTIGNYTFDGSAWVQNFPEAWHEKRICLNTASPTFTPVDPNNPTITEVEAWKNANLSLLDQTNGTQLVYFVPGDGGSCDNPDFTWTLNKGSELITLSNKRIFNTKTVYVDAGSGSDVTGKRGYREFPFKTLNAAVNEIETNEVLHVFPGTYNLTNVIDVLNRDINIHLENGVVLNNTAGHFLGNYTWQTGPYNVGETGSINITGYGELKHQPTSLTRLFLIPYDYSLNVRLKKLELLAGSNQAWGAMAYSKISNIEIDDIISNNNKIVYASGVYIPVPSNAAPFNRVFKSKNIFVTNQTSRSQIIRDQTTAMVDNSRLSIEIDNIYFDSSCISGQTYLLQRDISATVDVFNYTSNVKIKNILNLRSGVLAAADYNNNQNQDCDFRIGSAGIPAASYVNSLFNYDIDNIITNGNILGLNVSRFNSTSINFNIKNGISNNCECFSIRGGFILQNNSVVKINANLETKGNSACGIIHSTSNVNTGGIKISGRYKTSALNKATIQVLSGTANNTIYLENCTLVNDGSVANITTNSVTPITIVCKNVFMNSTINDPNINLVGNFYQNAIYAN